MNRNTRTTIQIHTLALSYIKDPVNFICEIRIYLGLSSQTLQSHTIQLLPREVRLTSIKPGKMNECGCEEKCEENENGMYSRYSERQPMVIQMEHKTKVSERIAVHKYCSFAPSKHTLVYTNTGIHTQSYAAWHADRAG